MNCSAHRRLAVQSPSGTSRAAHVLGAPMRKDEVSTRPCPVDDRVMLVHPHPGPLPRERENGLPRVAGFRAGASHGGYSVPRRERAFTMVEIAICLAIIGFA